MRPRGNVRRVLAEHLPPEGQDGKTWHDLALKLAEVGLINSDAPSEMRLVRQALKDMVKAGEAEPTGEARRTWSRKPLKLYGARRQSQASAPEIALCWPRAA